MSDQTSPVPAEIIGNLQVASEIIRQQEIALRRHLGASGLEGSGLVQLASLNLLQETIETLDTQVGDIAGLLTETSEVSIAEDIDLVIQEVAHAAPEDQGEQHLVALHQATEQLAIEEAESQEFMIPTEAIAAFIGGGHEFHIAQLIKACFNGKRLPQDQYWAVVRYVRSSFGHIVTHTMNGNYKISEGWTVPEPAEVVGASAPSGPQRNGDALIKAWRREAHDMGVPVRPPLSGRRR